MKELMLLKAIRQLSGAATRSKKIKVAVITMCLMLLAGCGDTKNLTSSEIGTSVNKVQTKLADNNADNITEASVKKQKSEEDVMKISINGTAYEVELEQNDTVKDIVKHMPLKLDMVRFAGHEFYSKLHFTPVLAKERTSEIKAGHVYYWDGWNAFVINYIDSNITPYQVVHIGEIKDKSICKLLTDALNNIQIEVN